MPTAPNKDLKKYGNIIAAQKRSRTNAETKIRSSLSEVVVMFVDIADSTKMKTGKLKGKPEVWIYNIYEFGRIVEAYLEIHNGNVVKYIGDEVMAVFKGKNKVIDAVNFISKLDQIEKDVSDATGRKTKLKISLDYGKVYYLKFDEVRQLDPQGTAVDRCARIAKLCQPGTILTSSHFQRQLGSGKLWHSIGKTDLKGLGLVDIFEFGRKTVELAKPKNYYLIVNKASHKVVEVKESSKEDYAPIIMYPCQKSGNQIWELRKQKGNFYSLINKHSKKCLEVKGAAKDNSTAIQQNTFRGASEQLWKLESNDDSSFFLRPKHANLQYLEQDAQTVPNEIGSIIQHDKCEHHQYKWDHQKWFLIPINIC